MRFPHLPKNWRGGLEPPLPELCLNDTTDMQASGIVQPSPVPTGKFNAPGSDQATAGETKSRKQRKRLAQQIDGFRSAEPRPHIGSSPPPTQLLMKSRRCGPSTFLSIACFRQSSRAWAMHSCIWSRLSCPFRDCVEAWHSARFEVAALVVGAAGSACSPAAGGEGEGVWE